MSELLATVVYLAAEGLDLLVNDLVCTNVATLGECLAANAAAVWSFSGVTPFMCLEVTQLREGLATSRCFARKWLVTGMDAYVDLKMRLLVEALVAVGHSALVTLRGFLGILCCAVLRNIRRSNMKSRSE